MRERPATSSPARRVPPGTCPLPRIGDELDRYSLSHGQHKRDRTDGYERKKQQSTRETESAYNKLLINDHNGLVLSRGTYHTRIVTGSNSPQARRPESVVNSHSFINGYSAGASTLAGYPSPYRDLNYRTFSPFVYRKLTGHKSIRSHAGFLKVRNSTRLPSKSAFVNRFFGSTRAYDSSLTTLRYNLRATESLGNSASNTSVVKVTELANGNKDIGKSKIRNCYRTIDETKFALSYSEISKRDAGKGTSYVSTLDGDVSPVSIRFAAVNHRISAPDLPPITKNVAAKGDKWTKSANSPSSTGNETSAHKPTSSANRRASYGSRNATASSVEEHVNKQDPAAQKPHSDSSSRKSVSTGSTASQKSDSVVDLSSTPPAREDPCAWSQREDGSAGSESGRQKRHAARGHRTSSWTTDQTESQGRLDTRAEAKNCSISTSFSNSRNNTGRSNPINEGKSNERIVFIQEANSKRHTTSTIRSTLKYNTHESSSKSRPRTSKTVNGFRNQEHISKHIESPNKELVAENTQFGTIESFAARGKMMRSKSEIRLNKKSQHASVGNPGQVNRETQKTAQRSLSRNLSVDTFDKIVSKSKQRPKDVIQIPQKTSKLRRFHSVSNLYGKDPQTTTNHSRKTDETVQSHKSIDAGDRLIQWLHVVNNIGEYDTDPKDAVFDYSDEPRKTDTAVHLVYEGD